MNNQMGLYNELKSQAESSDTSNMYNSLTNDMRFTQSASNMMNSESLSSQSSMAQASGSSTEDDSQKKAKGKSNGLVMWEGKRTVNVEVNNK